MGCGAVRINTLVRCNNCGTERIVRHITTQDVSLSIKIYSVKCKNCGGDTFTKVKDIE